MIFLVLTPEYTAARSLVPIAYIFLPIDVLCRMKKNTTAIMINSRIVTPNTAFPALNTGIFSTLLNQSGNFPRLASPINICDSPRNNDIVPIVTIMDGKFAYATNTPLNVPKPNAIARPITHASPISIPAWNIIAVKVATHAMIDATERSICPAIIMSVIVKATRPSSIYFVDDFRIYAISRKLGDKAAATIMTRISTVSYTHLKHLIELRGIGIVDVKTLFGVQSVRAVSYTHLDVYKRQVQ